MIKGLNHVGISVADLERSLQFYRDLLGMRVSEQPESFSGEAYERILALRGASGKSVMLRHGEMRFELFQFSAPAPRPGDRDRPVCDHGITHFCINVSDIETEYARLKAVGVRFHCEPLFFAGAGKATYGRDPDGNVFELFEEN